MRRTRYDTLFFADDGRTPNNRWPVIIHHAVDPTGPGDRIDRLAARLDAKAWPAQWRGGVFDYHHFHSNAHEVLAVGSGRARLRLGGEAGQDVEVMAGDVLILPAGTGHCAVQADATFQLVAGYPEGQADWDLCRSGTADIHAARQRIRATPAPMTDPITGRQGGLREAWQ